VIDERGNQTLNDLRDPAGEWRRVTSLADKRLFPEKGGGRRMRHPFLPPIVYYRNPDRWTNFLDEPLRKMRTVVTRNLEGSGVAKYPDDKGDRIVREVWDGPVRLSLFRQFRAYLMQTLPVDRYIGWQPRDLSPRNYFVELLNVELGGGDEDLATAIGKRPALSRDAQSLTVTFKLIQEAHSPVGELLFLGY